MKIVNISGGLGNQMFQYAFALYLKSLFKDEEILIDTSHYHYIFLRKWKTSNLHNGYEIENVFPNANLPKASARYLMSVTWYVPNYWLSRIVRKILPRRKSEYIQTPEVSTSYDINVQKDLGNCYYEGIWQSIHFYLPIKEKICEAFKHPIPNEVNSNYITNIQRTNSVGIHVRRGDYLNFPTYQGICNLDYYKKSIREILKDGKLHTFFIFSNDMKWCKENIIPLLNGHSFILVTENRGKDSCWDLFLMTYCKDLIIANSSFSWWGAFLNTQGGRIIASDKWVNKPYKLDFWDPTWIRV